MKKKAVVFCVFAFTILSCAWLFKNIQINPLEMDTVTSNVKKIDCTFCCSDTWENFSDNKGVGLYQIASKQMQDLGLEENQQNLLSGTHIRSTFSKSGTITNEINRDRNICTVTIKSKEKTDIGTLSYMYCQNCLEAIQENQTNNYILVSFDTQELIPMRGIEGASYHGDYSILYYHDEERMYKAYIIYTPKKIQND